MYKCDLERLWAHCASVALFFCYSQVEFLNFPVEFTAFLNAVSIKLFFFWVKSTETLKNIPNNFIFYFFRSTSTTSALAQQQLLLSNSGNTSDSMTMSTTASALARAFGIVVRTIADLLSLLQDYGPLTPPLNRMLDISYNEAIRYDFWNSVLE